VVIKAEVKDRAIASNIAPISDMRINAAAMAGNADVIYLIMSSPAPIIIRSCDQSVLSSVADG